MAFKVIVPSNLDIDKLLRTQPPTTFKTNDRNKEILYYFCSVLIWQGYKYGAHNEENKGFIPLYSKYLKQIHTHYLDYLAYLIDAGVLECDNHYIKDKKSKGYRFTAAYIGVTLKEVELKDYLIRKCLRKQAVAKTVFKKESLKKYRHIVKWFTDKGLEIDKAAAEEWIARQYVSELKEIYLSEDVVNKELKAKQRFDVWQAAKHFVKRMDNREFGLEDFTADQFGRRLHGMFTYQMKELRNFITYRGQKLAASDVKNSQPYFTIAALDKGFWMSKKQKTNRLKLCDINEELYNRCRGITNIYGSIMCLDSSQDAVNQISGLSTFKEDAVSGFLYERFMSKLNQQPDLALSEQFAERVANRDAVKGEVFRSLYSRNDLVDEDSYWPTRVFNATYPDATRLFAAIKSDNRIKTTERHKLFAEIIQQVESYCVLKLICGKIAAERPNLPIFTIHDSVVTTVGNEQYVKSVIEDVLATKIGMPPKVKFEYWTPEHLYKTLKTPLSN